MSVRCLKISLCVFEDQLAPLSFIGYNNKLLKDQTLFHIGDIGVLLRTTTTMSAVFFSASDVISQISRLDCLVDDIHPDSNLHSDSSDNETDSSDDEERFNLVQMLIFSNLYLSETKLVFSCIQHQITFI